MWEKVHAICIAIWRNLKATFPGGWLNSFVIISVISNVMAQNRWTNQGQLFSCDLLYKICKKIRIE